MTPRDAAIAAERITGQPSSTVERFSGYGVMGLPFRSGHVLGMRRFPSSSVGPGYTSVWHRDPDGAWTFYTDTEPLLSCNRYFGSDVNEVRRCAIDISWPEPFLLRVGIPGELAWECRLVAGVASRAMNAVARWLPPRVWTWTPAVSAIGVTAGLVFRAGRVRLHGRAPNGQMFIANPRILWLVERAEASVGGVALGEIGRLDRQARLGDFWIPQRGLFVIGGASFEAFDASRHRAQATMHA